VFLKATTENKDKTGKWENNNFQKSSYREFKSLSSDCKTFGIKRSRKTHLSFKNKTEKHLSLFFRLFSSDFLYLPIDHLIGRVHMLEDKQSAVWIWWKPSQKAKLTKLIYVFPRLKNGKFDSKVRVDRSSFGTELILHSRKWSRSLKTKKSWPA